jgi:hypothetical protein
MQAAIAVNTHLRLGNTDLARTFFLDRLKEAMDTHGLRARERYLKAWPGTPFWKSRSAGGAVMKSMETLPDKDQEEAFDAAEIIRTIHTLPVQLSPELSYVPSVAVLDDHLEVKMAVDHPSLSSKFVYLDQQELKPLLDLAMGVKSIAELLALYHTRMPLKTAGRLISFLWAKKILI